MSLPAHLHVVGMLRFMSLIKNQLSFPTPFFLYSVLVSISVFMALSTMFHSINSPDNSLLSHSVFLLVFLPYWSFQLCYLFMKVYFNPDIILCGWLSLEHQLTNKLAAATSGWHWTQRGAAYLWHVVVSPLPLLLLQLDRDAPHWTTLDALHQMGHKSAVNSQKVQRCKISVAVTRGQWFSLKLCQGSGKPKVSARQCNDEGSTPEILSGIA